MTSASTSRLQNLPVSWFAMIMGLAGFTLAWRGAETTLDLGFALSPALLLLAATLFATLLALFAAKAIKYPQSLLAELRHPVKLAFVPTFSIALILLSVVFLTSSPTVSFWLWTAGTGLHLLLTLYVLSSWIHHERYDIAHLNPAWFIPVVGNVLVPIAGVSHASPEICWFFFSVGLFFWPVLTAIIFYRLIFHGSLPERFMPTLFIFIAPPAAAFISYHRLIDGIDAFARILYGVALFMTLLLLTQAGRFVRLKFYLSWWAYSFPLAAVTIATFIMAKASASTFYAWLGGGLLALLSAIVAVLLWQTGMAVWRRESCLEG